MHDDALTQKELIQAYKEAGLWRQGMTFAQALRKPLVYWGLARQARNQRLIAEHYRQLHAQPKLI